MRSDTSRIEPARRASGIGPVTARDGLRAHRGPAGVARRGRATCSTSRRARRRCGPSSTPAAVRRRRSGRPWSTGLARRRACPRPPAASASAGSRWRCCSRRSARHVAPAPFARSVVALDALRGTDVGGPRLAGGVASARVAWRRRRRRQLVPYAPSADVASSSRRRRARGRSTSRPASARRASRRWTSPASVGWLAADLRRRHRAIGGDGRGRPRSSTRGAVAYAAELLGGAQRVLDLSRRVRQGPGAVRPADRQLPGGEAPLRRHARRRRGHALGRLLRGLVHRRRRSRRVGRRVDRQGVVLRRGPAG